jgi:hypothetical protein
MARQERLDDLPQFIGYKRTSHGTPPVSDYSYLFAYGVPFLLEFLNGQDAHHAIPRINLIQHG